MKVAVIGSGVSGLAATWLLNEHSQHEVHLYEADSRLGGHANTVDFTPPGSKTGESVPVDTGFIVMNPTTYPNFLRFLKTRPGVSILPTEMTFSVSRDRGLFEWAGKNLSTIFCQITRLLDPQMWRLIYDVLRFNACSRRLIMDEQWHKPTPDGGKIGQTGLELSIGEYLDREGYSQSFRDNYLIPMTACIWSTPPDTCFADFPARTLIQFFNNHHLLQITGKPSWLTINRGSKQYVQSIISNLPKDRLHLSSAVTAVHSKNKGFWVVTANEASDYDHVIFACHSDTAHSILKRSEGATEEELNTLGSFKWSRNEVVLHSDERLMPRNRIAWSCWNFLTSSVVQADGTKKANADVVSLTYGMNDLQSIPYNKYGAVLVTLNPPFEPEASKVAGRYKYDHPVLDAQAILLQSRMGRIQGMRGISYAGAYLRYGFHEDGFTSGLRADRKSVV